MMITLNNKVIKISKGINEDSNLLDWLMFKVYSLINIAYLENEINEKNANNIRKKYLLMSCKLNDDKDAK